MRPVHLSNGFPHRLEERRRPVTYPHVLVEASLGRKRTTVEAPQEFEVPERVVYGEKVQQHVDEVDAEETVQALRRTPVKAPEEFETECPERVVWEGKGQQHVDEEIAWATEVHERDEEVNHKPVGLKKVCVEEGHEWELARAA
ncbi:hypothetical protein EAH_00041660 [Eimeria acervulina]|uniref:Uncharacterized protein n=1 Tax=Eimeria acervulina TaxID=5801 RepID=U6GG95_EIMAC|nr:hypothetical protein EAH_00041660 [Eimeria acervulina]CDI79276.1 hypothetical protein EAH_00041660 [Eimeria acervulina]